MEIKYPILTFKNKTFMDCARFNIEFETCTNYALKDHYYEGLLVIDSEGLEHHIVKAKKIGTIGLFWGYNIFLNQKIRVSLEYQTNSSRIDIEDFKDMIIKSSATNYFLEDIIAEVMTLESIEDIISLICSKFFLV